MWTRSLRGSLDPEAMALALVTALRGGCAGAARSRAADRRVGTRERWYDPLRVVDTLAWMQTPTTDVLACRERAFEARLPEERFTLTWTVTMTSVAVHADAPAFEQRLPICERLGTPCIAPGRRSPRDERSTDPWWAVVA